MIGNALKLPGANFCQIHVKDSNVLVKYSKYWTFTRTCNTESSTILLQQITVYKSVYTSLQSCFIPFLQELFKPTCIKSQVLLNTKESIKSWMLSKQWLAVSYHDLQLVLFLNPMQFLSMKMLSSVSIAHY